MLQPEERIWRVVGLILPGYVATYGQVAALADLPGRSRMVSRWMGMAPSSLSLPWHRVINSRGRISIPKSSEFYSIKRDRLLAEGVQVLEGVVNLKKYTWQPDQVELMFALDNAEPCWEEKGSR